MSTTQKLIEQIVQTTERAEKAEAEIADLKQQDHDFRSYIQVVVSELELRLEEADRQRASAEAAFEGKCAALEKAEAVLRRLAGGEK